MTEPTNPPRTIPSVIDETINRSAHSLAFLIRIIEIVDAAKDLNV